MAIAAPTACRMAVDQLAVATGAASNRLRFAGSVSCFTSIAIDRAGRSSPVLRSCQRSIGSVSTASKRRHMPGAWCCVCMQVNETGHAQLAFEHVETKTEEVVFSRRSWLSFIVGVRSELVRSYDRHLPEVGKLHSWPPASPSGALFIVHQCWFAHWIDVCSSLVIQPGLRLRWSHC